MGLAGSRIPLLSSSKAVVPGKSLTPSYPKPCSCHRPPVHWGGPNSALEDLRFTLTDPLKKRNWTKLTTRLGSKSTFEIAGSEHSIWSTFVLHPGDNVKANGTTQKRTPPQNSVWVSTFGRCHLPSCCIQGGWAHEQARDGDSIVLRRVPRRPERLQQQEAPQEHRPLHRCAPVLPPAPPPGAPTPPTRPASTRSRATRELAGARKVGGGGACDPLCACLACARARLVRHLAGMVRGCWRLQLI